MEPKDTKKILQHIKQKTNIFFFKTFVYLFIYLEAKGGRKRGRETSISCRHAP